MKQRILLVGGRYKAKALARSLISKGYALSAVNRSETDCQFLSEIDGLQVIHGDGTKPYVLDDLNAQDYDIVIALTPKDDDNLVACELCRRQFGVRKTVSLLADPSKRDFFHAMGVDRVICPIEYVTDVIEQQAFVDQMATVMPLYPGDLEIAEIQIEKNAAVSGKSLQDLTLPHDVIVGCVIRQENAIVPSGETRLQEGDQLIVICKKAAEAEVTRIFTRPKA